MVLSFELCRSCKCSCHCSMGFAVVSRNDIWDISSYRFLVTRNTSKPGSLWRTPIGYSDACNWNLLSGSWIQDILVYGGSDGFKTWLELLCNGMGSFHYPSRSTALQSCGEEENPSLKFLPPLSFNRCTRQLHNPLLWLHPPRPTSFDRNEHLKLLGYHDGLATGLYPDWLNHRDLVLLVCNCYFSSCDNNG